MPINQISRMRIEKLSSSVFTPLDEGGGVLLNVNTLVYYSLNQTGVSVWRRIEEQKSVVFDDLINAICEEFDVAEKDARRHVAEFIERLEQYKLVTVS